MLWAANYRWTNADPNDSFWATAGNWIAATTAPGAGDLVYSGNAAPNAAQSITLTANGQGTRVTMEGQALRSYILRGSDCSSWDTPQGSPGTTEGTIGSFDAFLGFGGSSMLLTGIPEPGSSGLLPMACSGCPPQPLS